MHFDALILCVQWIGFKNENKRKKWSLVGCCCCCNYRYTLVLHTVWTDQGYRWPEIDLCLRTLYLTGVLRFSVTTQQTALASNELRWMSDCDQTNPTKQINWRKNDGTHKIKLWTTAAATTTTAVTTITTTANTGEGKPYMNKRLCVCTNQEIYIYAHMKIGVYNRYMCVNLYGLLCFACRFSLCI